MKKLVSILLVLSIICSSYSIAFATDYNSMFNTTMGILNYSAADKASREAKEAKEAVKQQTALEQLNNNNKPSYFIQLKNQEGGLLSIDMATIISSEFKKSYDIDLFKKVKNVNIFRDIFGNIYISQEFSNQDEAEKELTRISKEYNEILSKFYNKP